MRKPLVLSIDVLGTTADVDILMILLLEDSFCLSTSGILSMRPLYRASSLMSQDEYGVLPAGGCCLLHSLGRNEYIVIAHSHLLIG